MAAVSDDQEPYDGPYADDLDHLTRELTEEPRTGIILPRTLNDVLAAARARGLDPFTGANGKWIGFECPVCRELGTKAAATVAPNEQSGVLVAECHGCYDNVPPGILETLGQVHTNGNGKPDNVVHLHPERANGTHPDPAQLGWVPLDLVTLGDRPRVPPAIGGLLYPGRRHILTGESESGKTWLAIAIAADELKAGRGVIWADLDFMGTQDILERLRQFGVPDETTRSLFTFYQPDTALQGYNLDGVLELIHTTESRLVILDAFTGLCHLHKLNPNEGMDIEAAWRLMQPLCDTNAAVGILDHVVKTAENRGRYASGSERKLSGADVAIGFQMIELYGRGKTGRSKLTVHKDRPAMLTRPVAGIFTLKSDANTHNVTWSLEEDHTKGTDGTTRLTGYMERISIYLEAQLPSHAVGSAIESDVTGNATHIRSALKTLVAEGYVTLETVGRANHYTSIKRYREADEDA